MTNLARKILGIVGAQPEQFALLRKLKRLSLTGFQIYPYRLFQPEHVALKNIVRRGMKVIDVGANIGDYSILFAKWGARVTAIEPMSSFDTLRSRVKKLDVECLRMAAGSNEGTITIYEGEVQSSVSQEWARSGRSRTVEVRRLDSLFGDTIDFIKIDVEGMELEVLQGAERILKSFKPIVLCEINEAALRLRGTSGQEILVFMQTIGYKCDIFSHVTSHYDVLFTPASSEATVHRR